MAVIDEGRGWWGFQCPARQRGLSHAHDARCTDGHTPDQCCECGQRAHNLGPGWPPVPPQAPAIDVAERLREMGIGPAKVESVQDADDIPREPKMITGEGPQGSRWGRGRGDLSPRDEQRLLGWRGFLDRFGREHR